MVGAWDEVRRGIGRGLTDVLPNPNADAVAAKEGALSSERAVNGRDDPVRDELPDPLGANGRDVLSVLGDAYTSNHEINLTSHRQCHERTVPGEWW